MDLVKNTALIWFTTNLRVNDNVLLQKASQNHDSIIGVYFIPNYWTETTSYGFKKVGKFRMQFILESLKDLKENLAKHHIPLFVFTENTEDCIPSLCEKHQIKSIYTQKEVTAEEVSIQKKVQENLSENIKLKTYYDQFLIHPDDLPYHDIHDFPKVFTEFRKKVEQNLKIQEPLKKIVFKNSISFENNTEIPNLETLGYETFTLHENSAFPFIGGETSGLQRIQHYFFETKNVSNYKQSRNGLLGIDYSTKFSAWLAQGCINAKTIYSELLRYETEVEKNDSTYWVFFELLWRDYFKYITMKFGNQIFQLNGISKKRYDWNFDQEKLNQWIAGKTPEPFVNANMIELAKTGWMSNRGRQNVASFWAKEWEQDWRAGAAYFESVLIDYDVHSNYGNWMYNSGVGNDPRNRKFNIELQAEKYDADKTFQNTWLS
ncbi:deoxyribodipyrimidine photo-lyase [Pustulibacterium marinum]|uniref:Cryptochrome DASH n=1 Tax=Pustulibacterium marinum TaxID=1224947 RepID=A0A1I7FVW9_9FLAO|nr:DASH family cryptochrome [Pustulibacterium marinum]SFU40290.1 deoxyribodipyrimidine photo-lyase [Pustulibacterium marinum]